MKLSVIVPIYNAIGYLPECLKSLQDWPFAEAEFLLVDDGSTDGSLEYCKKISETDDRFQVLHQENQGVSKARNLGMSAANGEWFFFLDADDVLLKEGYEALESALDKTCDFIAFSYDFLYEGNRVVPMRMQPDGREEDFSYLLELVFADSAMNTCWGKLFRADRIRQEGIQFPESLPIGEDYMFVAKYVSHCKSNLLVDVPVLLYRQHGKSAMRRYEIKERLKFTEVLYQFQKETVNDLVRKGEAQEDLPVAMETYYFRVLTNLAREFCEGKGPKEAKAVMEAILSAKITDGILLGLDRNRLPSFKRLEAFLFRRKMVGCMGVYFWLKGKL